MDKKPKNPLVIPDSALALFEKGLKPSQSRAVVFENDKQRNIGVLKKGLMKPGMISFEVLRRAVNAVPVARICVDTLKKKIAKTKWVIKTIDPMAEGDEEQIKEVTDLLKNPNEQDSMRSFLDKILEDLLVLDVVCIEKTRFPDDKLARLYQVDASTVRPVYDEFGNQDIAVPLPNGETPPTSFLQIFNNSLYGGPESGEIVAAWSKKDFVRFHMNPQGTITNFGYGLSPIEAVLSVVSNLLSADNFNGNYFDEGAFPPIILQLAQSLEQRQLEAYKEYLYQQIEGNFHKPAIIAGGGEMKVHNLKDLTNREMQFMEYTLWLSKLMCAAYGLDPQDIGLTDTTGSKSVAENQKDLSESKGYGSYLDLIKEIINSQIVWKDFGYTDLEFEWVAIDSTDPKTAAEIQDIRLKNGSLTLNEVREKAGELSYEKWADQPMVLKGDGYAVIHTDEHEGVEEEKEVAGEKVYSKSDKSLSKAIYTQDGYKTWLDDRGYGQPFICMNVLNGMGYVIKPPVAVNLLSQDLECEITQELAGRGYNVKPVRKTPLVDLPSIFTTPEVGLQFDRYINMTPEYDSEKWRAKHGGSRKFPYYLVSEYIDGFALNSNQIRDDMKRDPASYAQAIIDLAKLWNIEKEMVLGDRRADQYIITKDKRAYGIDYQFKGDKDRWESSSTAIAKFLIQIPELYRIFTERTVGAKKEKSLVKRMLDKIKSEVQPVADKPIESFQDTPVMFGQLFPDIEKDYVKNLFRLKDLSKIYDNKYKEMGYNYNFDEAVKTLRELTERNSGGSGGLFVSEDVRGLIYSIYFK